MVVTSSFNGLACRFNGIWKKPSAFCDCVDVPAGIQLEPKEVTRELPTFLDLAKYLNPVYGPALDISCSELRKSWNSMLPNLESFVPLVSFLNPKICEPL